MPYEIEATAATTAAPDEIFRHLAVPEAWGAWGRFPTAAKQTRKGDTTTYGVGAVKSIWPAAEQTVAYEPDTHFAYIALKGLPVRHYRCDVYLDQRGTGTFIRWHSRFEPLVPGTGAALRLGLKAMIDAFARWLPAHAEHCPPDCPARRAGDL